MPINKVIKESSKERIQRFTVHDLRRTFRTMLSRMNIPRDVAELCINHRQEISGELHNVERYDRYVKLKERRQTYDQIAEKIMQLTTDETKPGLRVVVNNSSIVESKKCA